MNVPQDEYTLIPERERESLADRVSTAYLQALLLYGHWAERDA